MKAAALIVAIAGLAAAAAASPRETKVFNPVPSNGVLNSSANAIRTNAFVGGYVLGRIQLTGTLTSVHASTWRTDSKILITAPDGITTATFQPFTTGTTYTSLAFNGSFFLPPGTNPAGTWTFRFYETVDDGGTAQVDANWNITITLTDDQATAPAATNLGALAAPGLTLSNQTLSAGQVRWFRFDLPVAIAAAEFNHLDLDTFGSSLPVAGGGTLLNDTAIGLYNSAGNLVAIDDDSCDGFTSQLSFGLGERLPKGDGLPFSGQNGPLPSGTYYLAIGALPIQFGPSRWEAASTGTQTGALTLNFGYDPSRFCYANCDGVGGLTGNDFQCFLNAYVAGQSYANCDGVGGLTGNDFQCFLNKYVAGCS